MAYQRLGMFTAAIKVMLRVMVLRLYHCYYQTLLSRKIYFVHGVVKTLKMNCGKVALSF